MIEESFTAQESLPIERVTRVIAPCVRAGVPMSIDIGYTKVHPQKREEKDAFNLRTRSRLNGCGL